MGFLRVIYLNILQSVCFFGIVGCIVRLINLPLSNDWKIWSFCYPLIGTLLFVVNEMLIRMMPQTMDIRVDLLFTIPMLLFLWLSNIAKFGIIIMRSQSNKYSASALQKIFILLAILSTVLLINVFKWFIDVVVY
jgi:hypothetical protein